MSTMFQYVTSDGSKAVNVDALKSEVRLALINQKVNACPITMRHAWHMSGTFCKFTNTGGNNGATIRFAPECKDPANAGLHIIRDLLEPVKRNHPEISYADLYVIASAMAIEFCGGPADIPIRLGRSDEPNGNKCPANGRLPDASQGAAHLRECFGRMGFNDQEIVALSGGHTLGSAHRTRSGFDGQWTSAPLKWDNEYFVNLLERTWTKRQWEGPEQYEDDTKSLFMLPTDIALITDEKFRVSVELYAKDKNAFDRDFAAVYGKLMGLGCPAAVKPDAEKAEVPPAEAANRTFRHLAMHGFVPPAKQLFAAKTCDIFAADPASGRNALHFAAFWGHIGMAEFLVNETGYPMDKQDFAGDTPLHDAASHGHLAVAKFLVGKGASRSIKNRKGMDAAAVARHAGYPEIATAITSKL